MSQNRPLGAGANEAWDPIERTVQIAGNSTFVVSLPKEWALSQDLDAGMSMYLYPHEDRLVATPGTIENETKAGTIDADSFAGETAATLHRIRTAYLAGCDRLTVTGIDALDDRGHRTIERTLGRLIGMEVETVNENAITATNILDAGEVSLTQTIAQARQLTLERHEDVVSAVLDDDEELARQVTDHDNVDRLFSFVTRGFYRGLENVYEINQLGTNRTAAFRTYRTACHLRRVGTHAEEIATVATRQTAPPPAEVADRIETLAADARAAVELGLAGDTNGALERRAAVRETAAQLDRQLYARTRDSEETDAYLYGTMLWSLRHTADAGVSLVRVTSDESIET
ncbi:PhoU domain-containing protein [Natrialbaceae archaeon A-arb3/5]